VLSTITKSVEIQWAFTLVFHISVSTDEVPSLNRKAFGFDFGWSWCLYDEIGTTRCEVRIVSFIY
jgi:hypothetical protein